MGKPAAYILGQAQQSYHNNGAVDHPLVLMQDIAKIALEDAGVQPGQVDAIACVDPFSWTYADLATKVAAGIDCKNGLREFWVPAGGTTPQDLLHQITQAMAEGDVEIAVLVGAEAMRTRRKATRAGQELPWPPRDKGVNPTRGQKPFSSEWEARHGLRLPIQSFPIHENAIRQAHGRTPQAQIELAAELLHKNAKVAADNPNAWFQDAPSADLIGTVSADNRMISYPYTKRMNAIMDVDQASALIVVSERVFEQMGSPGHAVAILGGAGSEEVWNPIERTSLSESKAMQVAFSAALTESGLSADEVSAFDFYSCFPSPIQMAIDALAMDISDERPFSITGGLAYAGGPGNNYVMHSLATAVTRLRASPQERIMVTGIGMANTKHTATLLANATEIPTNATGVTHYRIANGEEALAVAEQAEGNATIVSYTIEYDREGQAHNVIYILDLARGVRAIANAQDPHAGAAQLLTDEPIGRTGRLRWDADAERQFFELA